MKAIDGYKADFYLDVSREGGSAEVRMGQIIPAREPHLSVLARENPREIPFCYIPNTSGSTVETDHYSESNYARVSEDLADLMIWDGSSHEDCAGCERAREQARDRARDCLAGRHDMHPSIPCECYQIAAADEHAHDGDHECDACECDAVISLSGGYGSYALAYRVDRPVDPRIVEIVDSLESYPAYDEGDISERETADEHEQWKDWGRREWRDALRALDVETDDDDSWSDTVDLLTDADLDTSYWHACQSASQYPERSGGDDIIFLCDQILATFADGEAIWGDAGAPHDTQSLVDWITERAESRAWHVPGADSDADFLICEGLLAISGLVFDEVDGARAVCRAFARLGE